jgi:hypothetical protein
VVAVIARLDVPAQCRGAARGDGTQNPSLMSTCINKPMPVPSHDLRQLQRRALE